MTEYTETVDAEFTSSTHEPQTGTDLAVQPRAALTRPVADVLDIIGAMDAYDRVKAGILKASDYQVTGTDKKTGKEQRFIKRSGWRKLSLAMGVSLLIKDGYPIVHRDEFGNAIRAECKAIARDSSGRECEGYGVCAVSESRFTRQKDEFRGRDNRRQGPCTMDAECPIHWAHAGDPIDSARQKLEHDLPATAGTRAKNIAAADLFGNGEVSAEEVSPGGDTSWDYRPPEISDDEFAAEREDYERTRGAGAPGSVTGFPKASPNKPASANQLATIAKLSRLIGQPEEPREDMSSAEASERITDLSREYNESRGIQGRRSV